MNIVKSQGTIVERVLRDRDGQLIRARFFVYESGGRIKARLLDFVYLAEQILINGANFLLSGNVSKRHFGTKLSGFDITSYFLPLISIYSLGSKPRAPTFA